MAERKCAICRRVGIKLFLKGEKCVSPKCPLIRKSYPPGIGFKRRKPMPLSEYGRQLREKQKLKNWYNLRERQLKNLVLQAMKKRGKVENIADLLIEMLESRLDNVVFRLGWAPSRRAARQLISHKFFLVNGKSVNIPSLRLKVGDTISFKPSKVKKKIVEQIKMRLKKHTLPDFLTLDMEKLEGKVVSKIKAENVLLPIDVLSVFEFYSK